MENFKIVTFKDGKTRLDIRISEEHKTAYLTTAQIAELYDKNKSTISRYIKVIFDEQIQQSVQQNSHILQQNATIQLNNKSRLYNLEIILKIGEKFGSTRGLILKQFVDLNLNEKEGENPNIIIYDNGTIHVEVEIVPDEDSAWMSVNQISALYGTSTHNIYMHIQNIVDEGEIENSSVKDSLTVQSDSNSTAEDSSVLQLPTTKKNLVLQKDEKSDEISLGPTRPKSLNFYKEILRVTEDGKQRIIRLYNLDMILAIGYRVKSTIAVQFRKWVTSKIKEIMFKGYTIEKQTCIECKTDILDIKRELLELKESSNKEIKYNPGDQLRGFIEIKRFLETAKRRILIIDNYVGHVFDEVLAKLNVSKIIITNPKNTKIESNENYKVIKSTYYHDRYVFVDNVCYHCGASIEDFGKFESTTTRLDDFTYEQALHNVDKK